MKINTPVNIEFLIHCHYLSGAHPRADSLAMQQAVKMFAENDCIEKIQDPENPTPYFRTTDKGAAWVQALCNVEMPRVAYVDKDGEIL